jgi:CheY-like chemotaxis protein
MRLLVVVDNPRVLAEVEAALAGDPPIELTAMATPRRAVGLVEDREAFDVVVCDADLVPAGGFALCRDVKALQRMGWDVPPVVLLISRAQDAWLADWAEADAWVEKPVDAFDLAEVVDALVDGRPVPELPGVGRGGGPMRDEAKAIEQVDAGSPAGGITGGGP